MKTFEDDLEDFENSPDEEGEKWGQGAK